MAMSETLEIMKPEDQGPAPKQEEGRSKGDDPDEFGKGDESMEVQAGKRDGGDHREEPEKDAALETEESEGSGKESEKHGEGMEGDAKTSSEEVDEKSAGQGSTGRKSRKKYTAEDAATPIERPVREKKIVNRFSSLSSASNSGSKELSIEKGSGTPLKDIPNVAFKLSKRKADDNLRTLHSILFGKKTTAHKLKRNISQFSGFVWEETEMEKQKAKMKDKLERCVKEKLLDFCSVLNIPISSSTKKEELSLKLLEFLESPHATTDVSLADKKKRKKRQKRSSSGKSNMSGDASAEMASKKQKRKSISGVKRKRTSKVKEESDDKAGASDTNDGSHEDGEDDGPSSKEETEKESETKVKLDELVEQKPGMSLSENNEAASEALIEEKSTVKPEGPVESPEKVAEKSLKKGVVGDDGPSRASKPDEPAVKKKTTKKESLKDGSTSSQKKTSRKKESSKAPSKTTKREGGKGRTQKKAKVDPTREEMHAVVVDILKEVDFNSATLSDILDQLGTHFKTDLMHRKAEVKAIITDVINNMSDEEDDEDEEGGANLESENDEAGKDDEVDHAGKDDKCEGNDNKVGKGNDEKLSEAP